MSDKAMILFTLVGIGAAVATLPRVFCIFVKSIFMSKRGR